MMVPLAALPPSRPCILTFEIVTSAAYRSPRRVGDVDYDGRTDVNDLLAVLGQWGQCDSCCDADLDHNRRIDIVDLNQVLYGWSLN